MKKTAMITIALASVVGLLLSGCAKKEEGKTAKPAKQVTVQIGFENSMSEPVGQALKKWQDLVAEKGDGSLKIELYPDSQLGAKSKLIDSMLLGESVVTNKNKLEYQYIDEKEQIERK